MKNVSKNLLCPLRVVPDQILVARHPVRPRARNMIGLVVSVNEEPSEREELPTSQRVKEGSAILCHITS